MENKYYVYEWFIKDSGEIFYVGKGSKKRYKTTYDRNSIFKNILKENDCDVRIVKYFDNEKDAFEYESFRIDELKCINQCKANINIGGAGGLSEYWTDRLRRSYSENNVMKREEQRKRMSENNPMKNPEIARHVADLKSRPVIINGIRYPSMNSAMNKYNVSYDKIKRWCTIFMNEFGEICYFEDNPPTKEDLEKYNIKNYDTIVFRDRVYYTTKCICNDLHISRTTLDEWLKRGFSSSGEPIRHLGDNSEYIFIDKAKEYHKSRQIPVIIDGITYQSIKEATKNSPLHSASTIRDYLKGRIKYPNHIITYVNQQPSQGNTCQSTLEGSTTNE